MRCFLAVMALLSLRGHALKASLAVMAEVMTMAESEQPGGAVLWLVPTAAELAAAANRAAAGSRLERSWRLARPVDAAEEHDVEPSPSPCATLQHSPRAPYRDAG